mmetsp:Transcript_128716/g.252103  ORF Transcript_128716/g.252103 Transcript_128716/m.252103 type:complete len:108 (+) Transcript_128716:87-410(+)
MPQIHKITASSISSHVKMINFSSSVILQGLTSRYYKLLLSHQKKGKITTTHTNETEDAPASILSQFHNSLLPMVASYATRTYDFIRTDTSESWNFRGCHLAKFSSAR